MRREGLSLGRAAREAGTTAAAVKRHAGPALAKTAGGRYRATATDRLTRPMLVPTPAGPVALDVRDSRSASRLGAYWAAVRRYLDTGDTSGLRTFRGKGIRLNKRFHPFVTDTDQLDPLADAGELAFDDLYDARRAA